MKQQNFGGIFRGILETPPKKYSQVPLTDRQIKNAKPAAKAYKLADGRGLYLQVTTAGGKLWRWKYRIGGKEKLLSIGKYPLISLLEAREAAETRAACWLPGKTRAKPRSRPNKSVLPPCKTPSTIWPPNGTNTSVPAGRQAMPLKCGAASRWIFCPRLAAYR